MSADTGKKIGGAKVRVRKVTLINFKFLNVLEIRLFTYLFLHVTFVLRITMNTKVLGKLMGVHKKDFLCLDFIRRGKVYRKGQNFDKIRLNFPTFFQ